MTRQLFLCPKCRKKVRRVSMSGGTVFYAGEGVPDPDDFCITVHPCCCTAAKGEDVFEAFLNFWQQSYGMPEFGTANLRVAPPPLLGVGGGL